METDEAARFDRACKLYGRFKELHCVPVDARVSSRGNVNIVIRNKVS